MTPISVLLDDRTALVTGAGSGIGRAVAVGVADAGAAVGCLHLTRDAVVETVETITAAGGRALTAGGRRHRRAATGRRHR